MTLQEKFDYLVELITDDERRSEFDNLLSKLKEETEYFTAPASTKYHMSCEQGLLQHSVSVTATMIHLKRLLAPEISDEQCVIVGLLHDLGKVGYPGEPFYIKNENRRSTQYYKDPAYKYNDNILHMPHAHRSIYLIMYYGFKLTPEEFQAIIQHDGQYVQDNKSYALKESKLSLLLHYADCWSSQKLEGENGLL